MRQARQRSFDRGRAGLHVLQPLAGARVVAREAGAVVGDGDDPAPVALLDRDDRMRGARVLAHVHEPLLHDPEHLDLLVRREPHGRVDLEVDVELAVGDRNSM